MDKLFLTILNMSITASFVIAAVCLARLFLKKAPKIISYCLWAVVLFNLVSPFKLESAFSLIPFRTNPVSERVLVTDTNIQTNFIGIVLDSMRNPFDETMLEVYAEELVGYRLYTNSAKITVSIPRGDYEGIFYLYDAQRLTEPIMQFELNQSTRSKSFTNLTSANIYLIKVEEGIFDGVMVTITD